MRSVRRLGGMVLLWMCLSAGALAAPLTTQRLHSGWEFRLDPASPAAREHTQARQWHRASVPGNVHTDLLASKLIPDPYVGAAEAGLQWIGLADWEYRSAFAVDAATRSHAHAELVL